jgi:hypothetical protein
MKVYDQNQSGFGVGNVTPLWKDSKWGIAVWEFSQRWRNERSYTKKQKCVFIIVRSRKLRKWFFVQWVSKSPNNNATFELQRKIPKHVQRKAMALHKGRRVFL